MTIDAERPDDAAAIDSLLDGAFGPDRHARTVYRLRAGIAPVPGLSFVNRLPPGDRAGDGAGGLAASLRFWPVALGPGRFPALLLGPLAVEPALQGRGFGKALMRHGLGAAAALGHSRVILVGEPPYYGPFGFTRAPVLGLTLPGPVDEWRFLGLALAPGAFDNLRGMVGRADGVPCEAPPSDGAPSGVTRGRRAAGARHRAVGA